MNYLGLALVFLAVASVATLILRYVAARRDQHQPPFWLAVALTVVALFLLTAVFDSLMIGFELFYYDPEQLSGLFVGLAPIEDFAYPLATALLLPALWVVLRARRSSRAANKADSTDAGAQK